MTQRMKEALKSPHYSKAFKAALRGFAKMNRVDAHFEARYLALLITEREL